MNDISFREYMYYKGHFSEEIYLSSMSPCFTKEVPFSHHGRGNIQHTKTFSYSWPRREARKAIPLLHRMIKTHLGKPHTDPLLIAWKVNAYRPTFPLSREFTINSSDCSYGDNSGVPEPSRDCFLKYSFAKYSFHVHLGLKSTHLLRTDTIQVFNPEVV